MRTTIFANRLPHTQDVGVGRTLPIGGTVDLGELTQEQAQLVADGAIEAVDEKAADDLHVDYVEPETDDAPSSTEPPAPAAAAPKKRAKAGGGAPGGSVSGDDDDTTGDEVTE